jgi:hypothetical protein
MAPLVAQKWSRGFIVTELTTAETGSTCSGIRAAIKNWHDSSGGSGDYYAILVGDTNVIPLCTGPVAGTPTDDLYGSTNGNDLDPEVFVGRFSVNSTAEATDQVTKTLSYEETPDASFNYGKALLVAHKQDAPGKYVGAHEAVRTAAYSVPPTFSTLYGHIPGVNNASVSNAIGMGQGLVAYRGHGSEVEWWDWNTSDQSYFNSPDVNSLSNTITPIVWSIACSNAALNTSPSIAETWMQTPHNRAVAHYGATEPSWTEANHKLDYYLFQAVYNLNMTTHAKAIRYAEKQMTAWDPGAGGENAWKYLLLGDPEMRIRRRAARTIGSIVSLGRMTFMVVDTQGNAIQDANVSFSQPVRIAGASLGNTIGARMALNAYTNADGIVSFDIEATGRFVVEAHTPLLDDVLSIEVDADKPQ